VSTAGNLALHRQRLVLTTVADAVRATDSRRRAPSVAFEEHRATATRGRYEGGRRNRVHVRVRGFLDEPSVDDDTIRAAVLHEIGHWADRWGRAGDYGIAAGLWMTYAGFLVLGVGLGGVLLPPHHIALGVAIMIAGVVLTALGVLTIRAWSWPAEYRADAFAAQHVGVPAVLTMIAAGRVARVAMTHPSPKLREARLTRPSVT